MRELYDNIFNVEAVWNPFTKEVSLSYSVLLNDKSRTTKEFTYKEVDEWNAFEEKVETGKIKVYDIHIHYDEKPSVCIYEVINGSTNTEKQIPVDLKIKY